MKNTVLFLKRLIHQALGLIPRRLPQGATEFENLVDHLIATYALPTKLRDDVVFVLSTTIVRFSEIRATCSPYHFVKIIRAAAAKQVAGAAFQDIKRRQADAEAASKAAPIPAATDNSPVANAPQQS